MPKNNNRSYKKLLISVGIASSLVCLISLYVKHSMKQQVTFQTATYLQIPKRKTQEIILEKPVLDHKINQQDSLSTMKLTFPDGQTITSNNSVKWQNLRISIGREGTAQPPQVENDPSYEHYLQEVVGNHSEIMDYSFIDTPNGRAALVLMNRTPPAAAQSKVVTYEYWVAIFRNNLTYFIEATVDGDLNDAKQKVLALTKQWEIPSSNG